MDNNNIDKSELLFNEGIELYEQENFEDAKIKFLEALKLEPSSEEIMYNLSLVYFELKEYDLSWHYINQIKQLDCNEIIDELQKVDSETKYEIPDNIPDHCEECDYFETSGLSNDEEGFCIFYNMKVAFKNKCYAFLLADEGKVSHESINQNYNKKTKTLINSFNESLNDEYLPKDYYCENCGSGKNLTETERLNKSFICQKCNKLTGVGKNIHALKNEMKDKSDADLFKIIIFAADYKTEHILAARKEIKNRYVDLNQSEGFKALLKENQNQLHFG
jgi:tetratricopeptide (TPR) repeat protein